MAEKAHGRCLCGKVSFTTEPTTDASICHCDMCRRWGGSPALAAHIDGAPEISGQEHLTWYNSSKWAERGFCKECGSSLFYRLKGDKTHYAVLVGAYDDQNGFKLNQQIFIEEKPDCYTFAGDIPGMTGAEVFAMYADKSESQP